MGKCHLLNYDEIKTFEQVEEEVAHNKNSSEVDIAIAALGKNFLKAIGSQLDSSKKYKGPRAGMDSRHGRITVPIPGRVVELPKRKDITIAGSNTIDAAIKRLFGRIRQREVLEAYFETNDEFYKIKCAVDSRKLTIGHIDFLNDIDIQTNLFQRVMLDLVKEEEDGDKFFDPNHAEHKPQACYWKFHDSYARRAEAQPAEIDPREAISVVRVESAGLPQPMDSLYDLCRKIAARIKLIEK